MESKKSQSMQIVVGDVVKLSAGDMIPADVLLDSRDFFVQQSGLTGESDAKGLSV